MNWTIFGVFAREFQLTFVNQSAARSCRVRYQKNFSFEVFEENLCRFLKTNTLTFLLWETGVSPEKAIVE